MRNLRSGRQDCCSLQKIKNKNKKKLQSLSVFTKASNTTSFEKYTLTPGQLIRCSQTRYSYFLSTSFPLLFLKNNLNVSWSMNSKLRDKESWVPEGREPFRACHKKLTQEVPVPHQLWNRVGQTPLPHSRNPEES